MTRKVKEGLNPRWKPSDLNWWLTQRYRHAPLIADNLYLAAQGTTINWLVLAVVGAVKTHYFKETGLDAFFTGETGDYEIQADLAPAHWDHRASIEEVLTDPSLLYAYDVLYKKAATFLDRMAASRDGEAQPLPVPPVRVPPINRRDPAPPKPPSNQQGSESPVEEPAPTSPPTPPTTTKPEKPGMDWKGFLIPLVSAIVGIIAGAIGPWGEALKVVWKLISTLLGG